MRQRSRGSTLQAAARRRDVGRSRRRDACCGLTAHPPTPPHQPLGPPTTTNKTNKQTRSQEKGAPLKKPGAYDPDKYYQEKDQGYGDVGVGQEPDAARTQADDRRGDPDFTVCCCERRAAVAVWLGGCLFWQ